MLGYILLGLFVLFAIVVAIRTAGFRPKAEARPEPEKVGFDREKALKEEGAKGSLLSACQRTPVLKKRELAF